MQNKFTVGYYIYLLDGQIKEALTQEEEKDLNAILEEVDRYRMSAPRHEIVELITQVEDRIYEFKTESVLAVLNKIEEHQFYQALKIIIDELGIDGGSKDVKDFFCLTYSWIRTLEAWRGTIEEMKRVGLA